MVSARNGLADTESIVVKIPIVREIGERHRLEYILDRHRIHGTEMQVNLRSRTEIDVEVIRNPGDGYVIGWTLGNSTYEKNDGGRPAESEFRHALRRIQSGMRRGMPYEMKINKSGNVLGLENKEEVIAHARKQFDRVLDLLRKRVKAETEVQQFRQAMSFATTPEFIEAQSIHDAALLYAPLGTEIAVGGRLESNGLLPNPLGGESFPSRTYLQLIQIDTVTNAAVFEWRQAINSQKSAPTWRRSVEKERGYSIQEDKILPQVSIEDSATYVIGMDKGWTRSMVWTRRTRVGQLLTFERKTFRMLPAE